MVKQITQISECKKGKYKQKEKLKGHLNRSLKFYFHNKPLQIWQVSMTESNKLHIQYLPSFVFAFPQFYWIPKQLKLNHCFWSEPPSINHFAAIVETKTVRFYILMVIWNNWNPNNKYALSTHIHIEQYQNCKQSQTHTIFTYKARIYVCFPPSDNHVPWSKFLFIWLEYYAHKVTECDITTSWNTDDSWPFAFPMWHKDCNSHLR